MKMVIAIVQDKFVDDVLDEFRKSNIHVTKLASTGGFFKGGNSTLLLGVEEEDLKKMDEIFKKVTETEIVRNEWGDFSISGANVFVLDVYDSKRI